MLIQRRLALRYQVDALLGRGGMATVYRVTDAATARPVALKQLAMPEEPSRRGEMVALFEREFHALAQLSHPRVIEVYDYGVDETGPYYTMELLDGGDLRARAPLPWRQACTLLCGVCSSLALIHSRRLVHRDVSPANIWCTRDGEGKLIDFGALAPMGEATSIVGTPAFVAPEVVQRSRAGRAHRSLLVRGDAVLRADGASAVSGAELLAARGALDAGRASAPPAWSTTFRRRSTRWSCRFSAWSPPCDRALRSRSCSA